MKTKISLTLVLAALIAVTAAFALASCGKRPIDIDDLEDLLEDEYFEVSTYEDEEEDVEFERLTARDSEISVYFYEYDEDDEDWEDLAEDLDDYEDDKDVKIISKSTGGNNAFVEAVHTDYKEYMFKARVGNTVIYCSCDKKDMKDAQKLLKKIGYK